MMIEKLDVSHIVITLSKEDMEIFNLDFKTLEMNNINSRKLIKRLLMLASRRTGVDVVNKKLVIDFFEYDGGCIFIVNFKEKNYSKKKLYRVKKEIGTKLYIFETIDDMLSCLETLYKTGYAFYKSAVYNLNNEYSLIITTNKVMPIGVKVILNEYTVKQSIEKSFISKVLEYGKVISEEYAILTIGGTFALRDI